MDLAFLQGLKRNPRLLLLPLSLVLFLLELVRDHHMPDGLSYTLHKRISYALIRNLVNFLFGLQELLLQNVWNLTDEHFFAMRLILVKHLLEWQKFVVTYEGRQLDSQVLGVQEAVLLVEVSDCYAYLVHPEVLEEYGELLLNHLIAGVGLLGNTEILLLVEFSLFMGDVVLYLVGGLIETMVSLSCNFLNYVLLLGDTSSADPLQDLIELTVVTLPFLLLTFR